MIEEEVPYAKCFPLSSDHHSLKEQDFYEFLIRLSSKVIHGETCGAYAADHLSWAQFYTLEKFFDLLDLKMRYESLE